MRLRFSIRDLLWLTLVVAIVLGIALNLREMQRIRGASNALVQDVGLSKYVYVVGDNVLYRVGYHEGDSGGIASAYRISDWKQLWETRLKGLVRERDYSAYDQQISIAISHKGLEVMGNESDGTYMEVLDPETGKMLSNKRLTHYSPAPHS